MKLKFVGWNTKNGSDKVWGVIQLEQSKQLHLMFDNAACVIFWGRRGHRLQTKRANHNMLLNKLINEKSANYRSIDSTELDQVYPEFERDLEKLATIAILKL